MILFAYHFPHKKTQDFIFYSHLYNFKIDAVIAAPYKHLKQPLKKFPTNINYIGLVEPMEICARLDIPYFVSKHNSSEPYAVHYTRGGPWFTEWQDVEYAENWNKE